MGKKIKKYVDGGIVAGAAQTAMGLGQAVYGMVESAKAKKELNAIQNSAPSLNTPSAYYEAVKKAYDQNLLNMQTEELNRTLATSVSALGDAGGRALVGGISNAQRSAARGAEYATEQQNLRQIGALQDLAGAEERTIGRKEDRYQQNLGFAQDRLTMAQQQIAGGLGSAVEGAAYGAMSQWEDKPKTTASTKNVLPTEYDPDAVSNRTAKKGMKIKGKFSHEENPVTMTDKNGKVVGEATGGEYIVNPKQAQKIAEQSAYAKALFAKFAKK